MVKVKLSDNKYNNRQYFSQKCSTLSDDSCMKFQKSMYVACKECVLFSESCFSSKGHSCIRNSVIRKV